MACSICREIPDSSYAFWKGGELEEGSLPEAAKRLEVVGAPYFDDRTNRTHDCLKRCPECGAIYRWSFEYEFLVPRSEESIELERLGAREGAEAVRRTDEAVARAKQTFHSEGAAWAKRMHSTDASEREAAVAFFDHHQTVYDEDLGFVMPALLELLVGHHHAQPCVAGNRLLVMLDRFAGRGASQRAELLAALRRLPPKERRPEIVQLLERLEKK